MENQDSFQNLNWCQWCNLPISISLNCFKYYLLKVYTNVGPYQEIILYRWCLAWRREGVWYYLEQKRANCKCLLPFPLLTNETSGQGTSSNLLLLELQSGDVKVLEWVHIIKTGQAWSQSWIACVNTCAKLVAEFVLSIQVFKSWKTLSWKDINIDCEWEHCIIRSNVWLFGSGRK